MKKQCLVVLVENNAGVLARVASLFMQRGFNIHSLTVSPTHDERISRITIMTSGDDKMFAQIMKQTGKLVETKLLFTVEPTFSLIHEILLIKFAADEKENEKLAGLISIYGAKVVDCTGGCMTVELTDTPPRLDGFIEDTEKFHVVEMCRSGAIAMERGDVTYDI